MQSISATRVPIEQAQQDQLRTLFASPGWNVLREILSSHCAEAQAAYMDASMYVTENATNKATAEKARAVDYNTTLDVLDAVQEKMDEWYRITLEQRR